MLDRAYEPFLAIKFDKPKSLCYTRSMNYNSLGELVPEETPESFPRVSSILDIIANPGLQDWKDHVGIEESTNISERAKGLGTLSHQLIESHLNDEHPKLSDFKDAEPYVNGFIKWEQKESPKVIDTELFLHHDFYKYAGTCDLVCELGEETWIVDYKTSKKIRPIYGLQLAAYRLAYHEMTGRWCKVAVLQLDPRIKRGYRFKETSDDFSVFLAALTIYQWVQSKTPPKSPTLTWSVK